MTLAGKNIIVGICGGIAAYKMPSFIRTLIREGAIVQAVLTANGARFVSGATLSTLTRREVLCGLFPENRAVDTEHISASDWAHLLLVAPATANCIGKFASGIADDFLSTLYLSLKTPVLMAPSMNSAMWAHPAVRANMEILVKRGVQVISPEQGELACGTTGTGRLPDETALLAGVKKALSNQDLKGRRLLITAGGTEEPIDPVRVISNKSSGRMGAAIAENAMARGASVTFVHGRISVGAPAGAKTIAVHTASEMQKAVLSLFPKHDVLVMAAAVGDFTPQTVSAGKLGKTGDGLLLKLKETPDILKAASAKKGNRKIIGFALENSGGIDRAKAKLKAKRCDLLVYNTAAAIGGASTDAILLHASGKVTPLEAPDKQSAATAILDALAGL